MWAVFVAAGQGLQDSAFEVRSGWAAVTDSNRSAATWTPPAPPAALVDMGYSSWQLWGGSYGIVSGMRVRRRRGSPCGLRETCWRSRDGARHGPDRGVIPVLPISR